MSITEHIKTILTGNDGKTSGKRVLGTLCILVGIVLTARASFFCLDRLSEQAVLISPLFATGTLFWGITAYFNNKYQNNNQ